MTKITIFIILFFSIPLISIKSQTAIGQWKDHLPYSNVSKIIETSKKIYCSTLHAIFTYNKLDNSIEKLSKVNGLSDIGVSSIAVYNKNETVIVAYKNGNIDLISKKQIYNINDIKRKQLYGKKNINNIFILDKFAYLSCGFGIVVLDIEKKEISDTYFIGNLGKQIEIFEISLDENKFYAASENGIYEADKNANNLADFNNWKLITDIPNSNSTFKNIVFFNNNLIAFYYDNENDNGKLYIKKANWTEFDNSITQVNSLNISNDKLIIASSSKLLIYNKDLILEKTIEKYNDVNASPTYATYSKKGNLLIADNGNGMLINEHDSYSFILPNGPFNADVSDIEIADNKVYISGGAKTIVGANVWKHIELYKFSENKWNSTVLWNSSARDMIEISIDPTNSNKVYGVSLGGGLIEFNNNSFIKQYNNSNSILDVTAGTTSYVKTQSLTFGFDGNLWITNSGVRNPICVKTKDDKWYKMEYPIIRNIEKIGKITETSSSQFWVQLAVGGGIFIFDTNGTIEDSDDDLSKKTNIYDENGQFITNTVNTIIEDNDAYMWIGTDKGLMVYYNPQNAFEDNNFYASRIIVESFDNDTTIQYLLEGESISTLAIDGANRKWVGTENAGVFLLSADCTEQILNFNQSNSPLFSNNILDIEINHKTAEVYFATSEGLISYKSTATKSNNGFKDVYVYPNPVRETYNGLIAVTGLANNVNVKITDISGNLVYETKSFGGKAIWNGKNFNNSRVKTGVYLVFCTNDDGTKKIITKLLFIN